MNIWVAITVYLTVSLPCILWYGNLYLEQWSLLDDLHFHTWTVMNCYRLWSLIIGVFIHMIRFIAMRDWGSCLNSMIIDMKGRTLNMISFFIAMIEKRKCNELLIIAMTCQISSMKTDTFISSWKLLWPLIWATKRPIERPNGHLPENWRYPELPQDMGDLWSHWVVAVWAEKMGVS